MASSTKGYQRECDLVGDVVKVVIPLLDVRLPGCKVRTYEADGGVEQLKPYGHCSLVACCTSKSSFDTHN